METASPACAIKLVRPRRAKLVEVTLSNMETACIDCQRSTRLLIGAVMKGSRTMCAMRLPAPGRPLAADDVPVPNPQPGQLLIKVSACAVCRTDLHIVDGELAE